LPDLMCRGGEGAALDTGRDVSTAVSVVLQPMPPSHPLIFDRRLLRRRRARAAALGPATFLIERVAEDLSDRLATVLRRFECAVDLGTPTDAVRAVLAASGKVGTIVAADALFSLPRSAGEGAPTRVEVVAADEEALPFRDAALDLVVSALALQFVNDLPGTLVQIRRALKPDGLLLAALIGGDTLIELRQAFASAEAEIEDGISPRVIPFADVREMGALLQRAGFALPVTDVDRLTVRYDSAIALMHDLRRMGATNPLIERSRRPLGRATAQRVAEVYAERFADGDGRIRATFEIVWLSGWAPHASQQKPLAPGSARLRLADALGTKELPLPGGGKQSSDSEDG
jgi:SAM-dependent methyltransferase